MQRWRPTVAALRGGVDGPAPCRATRSILGLPSALRAPSFRTMSSAVSSDMGILARIGARYAPLPGRVLGLAGAGRPHHGVGGAAVAAAVLAEPGCVSLRGGPAGRR